MPNSTEEHKKLLFKYAVISARLEVREFFLDHAVKEVYENIGQILSLVRMQLASYNAKELSEKHEDIMQTGNLVAQSIRDLRSMCRNFYPDDDIIKENGLVEVIELTLTILGLTLEPSVTTTGDVITINRELKLILFKVLLNVLISIKEDWGDYRNLVISYIEAGIELTIRYKGRMIDEKKYSNNKKNKMGLTVQETIDIIDGEISYNRSKNGIASIILKVPVNNFYEYK